MTTDPPTSDAVAAPPKLSGRPRAAVWPGVLLGAGLLAAGVLFAVDPAKHALYPACWFYATTGWECPGCGGLRATHQLLHGKLAAAWALNPLAVLLVPVWVWLAVDILLRVIRGHGLPGRAPRPAVPWLGLAGLLLFTVLRNLPGR